MNATQQETVRLMKLKAIKKHRCEKSDIVFGSPAFGDKVPPNDHHTAKIAYVYRGRLKGVIRYDGKTISTEPGGS